MNVSALRLKRFTFLFCFLMANSWLLFLVVTAPGAWMGKRLVVPLYTGSAGGKYQRWGEAIAESVAKDPDSGIKIEVESSTGSFENLNNVSKNSATFGLTFGTMTKARMTLGERVGYLNSVSRTVQLDREAIQIVVPANGSVKSVKDITCDRRIYVGQIESGTRLSATHLLEAMNRQCNFKGEAGPWSKELNISYDAAADMLLSRKLDAAIFVSGANTPAVKRLLQSSFPRFEMLNLPDDIRDKLVLLKLDYEPVTIEVEGNEIKTVSSNILIATNKETPSWIVQSLVSSIKANKDALQKMTTKATGPGNFSPLVVEPDELNRIVTEVQLHEALSPLAYNWFRWLHFASMQIVLVMLLIVGQLFWFARHWKLLYSPPQPPAEHRETELKRKDKAQFESHYTQQPSTSALKNFPRGEREKQNANSN